MLDDFFSSLKVSKTLLVIVSVVSVLGYFMLGYCVPREEIYSLFFILVLVFIPYFLFIYFPPFSKFHYLYLVVLSFVVRGIFLLATPLLSDDFYRFIWDGRLIEIGINPYLHLPDYIYENQMITGSENKLLYEGMNSPSYFSVYPAFLQYVFFVAAKFSFGNNTVAVVLIRLFLFLGELGTFFYLKKILEHLKINKEKIFWYLLNPLVIIEISGNLHPEGIMLFFVLASFYYLIKNRGLWSSVFLSLAICTKMIPLILLPIIVKKIGLKEGLRYVLIMLVLGVLLFLPLMNQELISNIGDSVGLYFRKFEFNASIYYLLRWVGFQFKGYNIIGVLGKVLPLVSFVLILYVSFKSSKRETEVTIFRKSSTILFIYYLLSLIVHPWYITFLVLLSTFDSRKYAVAWSLLIFGTYISYSVVPYQENLWVVSIEYITVITLFFVESIIRPEREWSIGAAK